MGLKRFHAYFCMLQAICIYIEFGSFAAKVSINQNITGVLENRDTNLTCSFFPEKGEQIISIQIIAKNITEDFDEKKNIIATFKHEKAAKLHQSGEYLDRRVSLTNITNSSNNATLKFHILKSIDEKDYICKLYYNDMEDAIQNVKSEPTRVLVKVPVRDVHINTQPNQIHYDKKTDNITLTCKASGDPEPEYTWFKENNNNTIISGTNLYVIEDVTRNNSGVYTCEAYNNINSVKYTQSNSMEINIVDEIQLLPDPAQSSNSSEQAEYVVPVILVLAVVVLVLVLVFIVRFSTLRKHLCNRQTKENNKESRWQNRWHGSDEKPSYAVVDTKRPGDVSKCMKENEIICTNKADSRWGNMLGCFNKRHGSNENPSYAVVDKKTPGNVSYGFQENENICKNKVPYQDAVYSEVFNKANIKSGMSKARTAVPPDNVDNNGDNDSQDQFQVLNI